jgi:hypothetical protein
MDCGCGDWVAPQLASATTKKQPSTAARVMQHSFVDTNNEWARQMPGPCSLRA